MPAVKPKLEKLETPISATFPSEITSASTATPLSAVHLLCKPDPEFIKTPISPPSAYTDFLSRAMSLGSPAMPSSALDTPSLPSSGLDKPSLPSSGLEKPSLPSSGLEKPSLPSSALDTPALPSSGLDKPSLPSSGLDKPSLPSSGLDKPSLPSSGPDTPALLPSGLDTPDSASASSSKADDSSSLPSSPSPTTTTASKETPPSTASAAVPPSPYTPLIPMSAPPMGAASFPSLKLPPSPAMSNFDSPLSASAIRSPFSARSVRPVFDWDAALKARFADLKKHKASRTSVRHIREVVTRTVTYTPKMDPAPRGKRRKVE